eukprot:SAG31_NODE_4034_length_3647_cov_26.004510_6_plen_57_part_00
MLFGTALCAALRTVAVAEAAAPQSFCEQSGWSLVFVDEFDGETLNTSTVRFAPLRA